MFCKHQVVGSIPSAGFYFFMKSVYLLFGEERFLVRQELAGIISKYPGAETENLSDIAPGQLLEVLFTPSLFSPQKIFIVHDFDFSADGAERLAALADIPPGTVVVFVDPQFDRRTKVFKGIEPLVDAIECKKLSEWDEDRVVAWIIKTANDLKKTISRDNARLLLDYIGFDLGTLYSEIEKLTVYLDKKKEIDKEDIERMVSRTGYDVYTLSGALLKKDKKTAFASLNQLFTDKEDAFETIGFIASQYRILYKIKLLQKRRMDQYQISRAAKASPYQVKRMLSAVSRFQEPELERAINSLYQTSLKLKTGSDQKIEMYLLLSELLGE